MKVLGRFALVFVAAMAAFGQQLQVTGEVPRPLTLTAEDLAKLPRATFKDTSGGFEVVYQGVWLHEILKAAGAPQGAQLRGKNLPSYVLAEAADGYRALFSLAETDPGYSESQILIVDTVNGKEPAAAQGRFRLLAASDHVGTRSVRQLAKLEVVIVRK